MTIEDRLINSIYFIYDIGDESTNKNEEVIIPVIPDSISYSYTSNFTSQSILGRLSPIYQYTGGSEQTLSFSIVYHEDLVDKSKYNDLVVYLEKIKSLSYPKLDKTTGLNVYPTIYFQLGEISGYCRLDVSIEWGKPFISQHYAIATINFTINILKPFSNPTVVKIGGDDLESNRNTKIYSTFNEEVYKRLGESGYYTDISDFVVYGDDNLTSEFKKNETLKTFDYQMTRLSNLYDAFAIADGSQKMNSLLGFMNIDTNNTRDNLVDFETGWFTGKKTFYINGVKVSTAKKNIEKYMDYYYKSVNKELTLAEKESIIKEITDILDTIESLSGEVLSYGSSN